MACIVFRVSEEAAGVVLAQSLRVRAEHRGQGASGILSNCELCRAVVVGGREMR